MAVALYPVHSLLAAKFGGREKLSATVFVLLGLAILLVPSWITAESSIGAMKSVGEQLHSGTVSISPPDESVAEWPLIGEKVHEIWTDAASNLEATLNKYSDQLQSLGRHVVSVAGSLAIGILQFVISIIIAGVFLVSAEVGHKTAVRFASSLAGNRGEALIDLAVATIRSVAKGVLGVAIIQSLLAAIGLAVIGVPAPGIWAFAVLILAIVQLPPLIVLMPIAVWVFSVAEPMSATIFAVYAFIVSISDSFLKPLFLGRGMDIPMLVILLGAIGGMIMSGIAGHLGSNRNDQRVHTCLVRIRRDPVRNKVPEHEHHTCAENNQGPFAHRVHRRFCCCLLRLIWRIFCLAAIFVCHSCSLIVLRSASRRSFQSVRCSICCRVAASTKPAGLVCQPPPRDLYTDIRL